MSNDPDANASNVVLRTERLVLRTFSLDDSELILELLNEPSFLENIGDKGVRTAADARRYLADGPLASYEQHGFGLYRAELAADGEAIGMCGLLRRDTLDDPDIGFAYLPRFWSRGYATEAAVAVMAYGRRTLGLGRLLAITSPANVGSQRVLEKVGFDFAESRQLPGESSPVHLYVCDPPKG
ncbi:MAG: GNAT family N-acetyltransferase [Acidobacteriota bacterium]